MNWEWLNIIGTVSFAISGAIVAMEEDYDILGVYVLGLVTAFGGGVIRNLLIGVPVTTLWEQGFLFKIALCSMTLIFVLPSFWIMRWKNWEAFFDALGLSAFAIQGGIYAVNAGLPLSAVIVAAMMTGIGGGMIRDILAGRKPLVLRSEVYAVWAMLGGLGVGLGLGQSKLAVFLLFTAIVTFRMLSVLYEWRLPRRSMGRKKQNRTETY